MAKLKVHPLTYQRELHELIQQGLTPGQAEKKLRLQARRDLLAVIHGRYSGPRDWKDWNF